VGTLALWVKLNVAINQDYIFLAQQPQMFNELNNLISMEEESPQVHET